ncbi:MAG TPA: hypothetical protein VFC78_04005 [Tepidisphaeraceae bacterium]|nr:hypothetical protein [Tepidisphaeraceae bacterium]
MDHSRTKRLFELHFPAINVDKIDWGAASEPSEHYNCMGFAVGVLKWWQPPSQPDLTSNAGDYWPDGVVADVTIAAFVSAAESEQFSLTGSSEWEDGYEKIVLCFNKEDVGRQFTHAARLISPDLWKSKFGELSDVEHTLVEIEAAYGAGRRFMRRPLAAPTPGAGNP